MAGLILKWNTCDKRKIDKVRTFIDKTFIDTDKIVIISNT